MRPVKRLEAELFLDGCLQLRRVHTHELEVAVASHQLLERVLGPILDTNIQGVVETKFSDVVEDYTKRNKLSVLAS